MPARATACSSLNAPRSDARGLLPVNTRHPETDYVCMRKQSLPARAGVVLGALVLSVLLLACSSEPSAIAITDETVDTSTTASTTASPTTTSAAAADEAAATSTPDAAVTTSNPSTTTAAPDTTTTSESDAPASTTIPVLSNGFAAKPLGDFHIEGYELVWLHEPDEETECQQGTLAVQADDGSITHTYDELGQVGGLQMHHGVKGAIALVEFCEEFVQAIHFANVAVPPADNAPEFLTATPPDNVFSLFDMGFSNAGWFVAEATMYEDGGQGWNEIVAFDAFDGTMTELADLVGDRTDHFAYDVDFVIPDEWSADTTGPNQDWIRLELPADEAHVQIEFHEGSYGVPPLGAGEDLINSFDAEQSIWERLGNGRSRRVQIVPSKEYAIAGDDGERNVEVVEFGGVSVVIERFVGSNTPSWGYETPYLASELVRIYEDIA